MGCRASQHKPLERRMSTTKELGWQYQHRQPSTPPMAVMSRLDHLYRNAEYQITKIPNRNLIGFNQRITHSPSLVRVSWASSASVKFIDENEQSDEEVSSRGTLCSRNNTSIYSSTRGENRPRSRRPIVTYYEHSPCSESTIISVPSLSQNSYSRCRPQNSEEYGPWAPGFL